MIKVSESSIQAVLMQYAMGEKRHEIAMPNIRNLFGWEADFLSVTKSWYIHEYEIKLSLSDYRADAKKKEKHLDLVWRHENGDKPRPPRTNYEQRLLNIGLTGFSNPRTPNYFWYVVDGFEIPTGCLPAYAGLMTVEWRKRYVPKIIVCKKAPLLHKTPVNEDEKGLMGRWLSFKLMDMYFLKYLKV